MSAATCTPLSGYQPAQLRKAIALVKTGSIRESGGDYLVRSSDGDHAYLVSAYRQTCTCRAGQLGRRCFHLCAAIALAAGTEG